MYCNSFVYHYKTANVLLLYQHMLTVIITKTGLRGNSFIKQIQTCTCPVSILTVAYGVFVISQLFVIFQMDEQMTVS